MNGQESLPKTQVVLRAEPVTLSERLAIPQLEWVRVDKPKFGEDYHVIKEKKDAKGLRRAAAIVADGKFTEDEKVDGKSASRHEAEKFSNQLAASLLRGENVREACELAEATVSERYYKREEADLFEKYLKRPISIFGDSKKRAQFTFSGVNILLPSKFGSSYLIEIVSYQNCFVVALVPTKQNGTIIYSSKVYPFTEKGINTASEFFPEGTILMLGTNGVFAPLAKYAASLYDKRYEGSKEATDLETALNIETLAERFRLVFSFEEERQIWEKLLSSYLELVPIDVGQEMEWISRLKEGIEGSIGTANEQEDDITLLATSLIYPYRIDYDTSKAPLPEGRYLKQQYLEYASASIDRGEVLEITGGDGYGKSTFLEELARYNRVKGRRVVTVDMRYLGTYQQLAQLEKTMEENTGTGRPLILLDSADNLYLKEDLKGESLSSLRAKQSRQKLLPEEERELEKAEYKEKIIDWLAAQKEKIDIVMAVHDEDTPAVKNLLDRGLRDRLVKKLNPTQKHYLYLPYSQGEADLFLQRYGITNQNLAAIVKQISGCSHRKLKAFACMKIRGVRLSEYFEKIFGAETLDTNSHQDAVNALSEWLDHVESQLG